MHRFRRLAVPSLALLALGAVLSCSAGSGTKGGPPRGDDGGLNIDGGGLDPDANLEGGTGILGDPQTCAEATAVKAYVGCDFWPTVVANNVWSIFDYAVVVANAGDTEADILVTGPGGVSKTAKAPPGSLAKIYLPWVPELKGPDTNSCGSATPLTSSVRVNKGAYHLTATRPVTVYQFNALQYKGSGGEAGKSWSSCPGNKVCPTAGVAYGCFSFSNDASLLLPSTAMTGNYRVTGMHGWSAADPFGGERAVLGAYFAVTATRDNTSVTVKVGSRGRILAGSGVSATGPGGTLTLTMNSGDVVELVGEAKTTSDLSGSLVSADKPVQVIAGVPCIQAPLGVQACDHVEESVFPAETLGKDYFVTVPTGPNGNVVGSLVRIFGNRDGTTLAYAPSKPAGAPDRINAGDVAMFEVRGDFRVTGSAEFAVGTVMFGGERLDPSAKAPNQKGDPSMSFATAIEQYRRRYIFLAPDDYDVSYVDIVYPDGTSLSLDGTTPPAGKAIAGGYSITRAKLGTGKAGAHELTATKPVGVQVMGYGAYTSYQYPGGLDLEIDRTAAGQVMQPSALHEDDTHRSLRDQARRFAQKRIAPHARDWEEAGEFPRELYREVAAAGLLGIGYPEQLGGGGGDVSHVLAVAEELILHGKSVGTVVGIGSHGIALPPIARAGTPGQIDRFVRPCLRGDKISALAITEPSGGSDVARLRTTAVRDGDHYLVNGSKTFITSGVRADLVTCAVRTGGEGHAGISLLVIERGTPGFTVGRRLEKMGWWASDTAELNFADCRVPVGNRIGEENEGFLAIMMNFATERLALAGNCVAIAELAYRESIAWSREREAFGKSLTGHQVVRHKLADMAARIAAARALTNEALVRHLRGEMIAGLAAMAKNVATDMVVAVCDEAVQIHGGYGYMREYVVERLFRDARLYPIGGGTREIMNEIIAKTEGY